MPEASDIRIAPAEGKLGVLTPGIGAVTTTFIAGVEAVRRGLAQPIGSLTQLATIRLGKRTDGRSPLIWEFLPLAGLNDLVFGGWDIAQRAGMKGIQEWLSFYFRTPMAAAGLTPEHDIFIQLMKLKNTLRWMGGEELITHLGLEYYD